MKKHTKTPKAKKSNKKRREYRSRAIRIVTMVLAVSISVWFLQAFLLNNADSNTERLCGFYLEDENSLDVVVVGSSEVYCDYAPGLAYKECGFTSYPFATEGNTVRNFKAIYEEIKRTQNPKLIIFETNGAAYGDANLFKEANLRRVSDNIPLNDTKRELIEKNATSDQIEYYAPFIKYHGTWDNFHNTIIWSLAVLQDKIRGYSPLKGIKNITRSYDPKTKIYSSAEMQARRPMFGNSDESLKEFLQYLKDNKVGRDEVLFVRVPHITTSVNLTKYQRGNSVGDTIKRYGYNFLSFELDDPKIGLDAYKDFYNLEHMNVYGQIKFTKFFAHYLQKNFNITPSKLTEEQKDRWDEAIRYYDAYVEYNEQAFEEGKDLQIGGDWMSMFKIERLVKD